MKSILSGLIAAGLALILAGCATPFRAPADVADVKLERIDSPTLTIEKIWLERAHGRLELRGFVLRRTDGRPAADTHLDVTLFDGAGRMLRSSIEQYAPPKFVSHFQSHNRNHASYCAVLDPLPEGTVRIEVRVHEGGHAHRT